VEQFKQISNELLKLLDLQVAAIAGRSFHELTRAEAAAYEVRRRKIAELQTKLNEVLRLS